MDAEQHSITTDVSGHVNLYTSAEQGQSGSNVENDKTANISLAFSTSQPITETFGTSRSLGPLFSTGTYGVYDSFSPYPTVLMSTHVPMSNSGTLSHEFHPFEKSLDLSLIIPPSISINDAIGMGLDLHTEVTPAPSAAAAIRMGTL